MSIGQLLDKLEYHDGTQACGNSTNTEVVVASALRDVLDTLIAGVVVLDRFDRILHVNAAANRIITENDGIASVNNHLHVAGRLWRLSGNGRTAVSDDGVIMVPRGTRRQDYILLSCPETRIVYLFDPACRYHIREELLRGIWGFSSAEARVAAALVEGLMPCEIAGRHGVSECTIRSQMRVVFEKTRTCRQAELVRLLTLVAGVRCEG